MAGLPEAVDTVTGDKTRDPLISYERERQRFLDPNILFCISVTHISNHCLSSGF